MKKKGFTLIELLVVIAIIAILVVLIILALNAARERARDSQRRTDLRTVVTGLELYNDSNSEYPQVATYAAMKPLLADADFGFPAEADIPDDPVNAAPHVYGYNATDASSYALGVQELEGAAGDNDTPCGAVGSEWEHCVGTDMSITPG